MVATVVRRAAWVNRGAIAIIDRQFQAGIDDISKGLTLGTEEPAKAYYNRYGIPMILVAGLFTHAGIMLAYLPFS